MATPELEPGWLSAAWTWIAGIGAAIVGGWKLVDGKLTAVNERVDAKADRADVKAALERLDKTNQHIEQLYKAAEQDRKFTRDLHDKAMDTMRLNQHDILRAITGKRS